MCEHRGRLFRVSSVALVFLWQIQIKFAFGCIHLISLQFSLALLVFLTCILFGCKVAYLTDYFFGSPKCLPGTQLIAVEGLESSPDLVENRGHLKCLSPEENRKLHWISIQLISKPHGLLNFKASKSDSNEWNFFQRSGSDMHRFSQSIVTSWLTNQWTSGSRQLFSIANGHIASRTYFV